jgi:archaellum component FlaF (FlaF/FlaG flagellin family)
MIILMSISFISITFSFIKNSFEEIKASQENLTQKYFGLKYYSLVIVSTSK